MHYIDTSVLTGYYCAEERSGRIQRVLSRIEGPTISPLVVVELYCAVARKVRSGSLERPAALRVFSEFQTHIAESRFRVVPIRFDEFNHAAGWIAQLATPLRVLDAIHLSTAYANDLVLVTSDVELARSAAHFGVKHKIIT